MDAHFLRTSGYWLQAVLHTGPSIILASVPHAQESLSLASLYVFMQALGLLWLFHICVTSVICTGFISSVTLHGETNPLLEKPLPSVTTLYVYYCVVRIVVLLCGILWTCSWEAYHDFPTLRRMLMVRSLQVTALETAKRVGAQCEVNNGVSTKGGSGNANGNEFKISKSWPHIENPKDISKSNSCPELPAKTQTRLLRETKARDDVKWKIALTVPIVVLFLTNMVFLIGQLMCEHGEWCPSPMLFDPTGRINRNTRFALFVAVVQWLQIWTAICPTWYFALVRLQCTLQRFLYGAVFSFVLPATLLRLAAWFVMPAGSGVVQVFAGIRHHLIDTILVVIWTLWLMLVSVSISTPKSLDRAGFRPLLAYDDLEWRHISSLFKYTLFIWHGLHFIRGCVSLGLAHAQNDLIVISLVYPVLLGFVWTATVVTVMVSRCASTFGSSFRCAIVASGLGLVMALLVAQILCSSVGKGEKPLLVIAVWCHLSRQLYKVIHRWFCWGQVAFAVDPKKDKDLRSTYNVERKLGRLGVRLLLLVSTSFAITLGALLAMGALQQRTGLYIDNLTWWRKDGDDLKIVNSGASVLTLTPRNETSPLPRAAPEYAICGHTWHGLKLVEYATLASLAYQENDLPQLLEELFPGRQVRIVPHGGGGHRPWLELEIKTCHSKHRDDNSSVYCEEVTVFAVSGTDIGKAVDYAEDLRMWMDSGSVLVLSWVFPTVRMWPLDTTAMVISGIHEVLKSLDLPDDQFHYREILEHVQKLPPEREAVITGHSLGGGIALVVGALTDRLSVALQPPGNLHSLAKHQSRQRSHASSVRSSVHKRSMSVMVEGDWVQNFDGHGGLLQTIACDKTDKSLAVGCHLLEGAICHLMQHCGDSVGPFSHCAHEYKPVSTALDVTRTVVGFAAESWKSTVMSVRWDSIATVWVAVTAVAFARFGAPVVPRSARRAA